MEESGAKGKSLLGEVHNERSPRCEQWVMLIAIRTDATLEPSPTAENVAQSFEWIPHGDKSARKRARAHVTRGFRRERAEKAEKEREEKQHRDSSSPPHSEAWEPPSPSRTNPPIPITAPEAEIETETEAEATLLQPRGETGEAELVIPLDRGLVLQRSLGSGRTDPFSTLPVVIGPETHSLLDHFLSGVAPVSFRQDNRADFQPVKELTFDVSISDSSAFHVILATAANDIAALHGQETSREAILHHGLALQMVNKRFSQERLDISDASIAAVALLAGRELLFGTSEGFNTHMRGLESMLWRRGGLEPFRESNPPLFAVVSWFDYSGSCNLVSRRRFDLETPTSQLLCSSTSGVPANILQGLPIGYDLYGTVFNTFEGLLTLTNLLRTGDSDPVKRSESSAFITRVDSELYHSIIVPETKGVRSRRRHIQQSLNILVLVYATLVSTHFHNAGVLSTDIFLARFKAVSICENTEWGLTVVNLFRYLLLGDGFYRGGLSAQMSSVIDVWAPLGWESWRDIKTALLDFFVYDSACEGGLQVLWQRRKSTIAS